MALIPVTFKHSTETGKEKSGKVSTITARMLYANTFSGKVGIVKGYKKDDATDELSVAYDNTATTSTTFRLVFNKGAVSIYGGVGIVEQGTVLDIARGLTNNSVGIRINLANPAGQEMEWYVKSPTETLQKDDLQIHDTDGVYEFELFKITTTGTTPTVSEKTTQYIQSVNDFLESKLKDLGFYEGSISLESGSTASTNKLTRQGNYVIGELVLTQLDNSVMTSCPCKTGMVDNWKTIIIGTVPEYFIPKNEGGVTVGCECVIDAGTMSAGSRAIGSVLPAISGEGVVKLFIKAKTSDPDGGDFRVYHSSSNPLTLKFGYQTKSL